MSSLSRRDWMSKSGLLTASIAGVTASTDAAEPAKKSPARSKIIVTGGHPGDPEYGCGGTIARYADMGCEVVLLYLNKGDPLEDSTPTRPFPRVPEATKACEILNARPLFAGQIDGKAIVDPAHYESFRQLLASEKPDAVFTHWPIDNHADHRAISMLVYGAWLKLRKSFALYYYEVSTGEDTLQFAPTEYVDISAFTQRKREACFAHASQSPDRYHPLQETITKMRGIESGRAQAEAFIRHVQNPAFSLQHG